MLVMARDVFHNAVRRALETDGWTITHDPLVVPFGDHNLFVDLGAERMLAAEKADRKIAVEIKSFLSRSPVEDLERALGQYVLYHALLRRDQPARALFLAVPNRAFEGILSSLLGRLLVEEQHIRLIVFEPDMETIVQWIE